MCWRWISLLLYYRQQCLHVLWEIYHVAAHLHGSRAMKCAPRAGWIFVGFGVPISLLFAIFVLALANSKRRVCGFSGSNRTPWRHKVGDSNRSGLRLTIWQNVQLVCTKLVSTCSWKCLTWQKLVCCRYCTLGLENRLLVQSEICSILQLGKHVKLAQWANLKQNSKSVWPSLNVNTMH